MDLISHVLVGKAFQESSRVRAWKDKLVIISFAVMPDLPLLIVYLLVGREKGRAFWIPHNSDWSGVREAHPIWSAMWEVPHSVIFLLLIVTPLVLWLKWPRMAIASYLSHIVLDLPTHAGEWSVKPFYPFPFVVRGFTNAWAWPFAYMLVSWIFWMLIIVGISSAMARRTSRRCGSRV